MQDLDAVFSICKLNLLNLSSSPLALFPQFLILLGMFSQVMQHDSVSMVLSWTQHNTPLFYVVGSYL